MVTPSMTFVSHPSPLRQGVPLSPVGKDRWPLAKLLMLAKYQSTFQVMAPLTSAVPWLKAFFMNEARGVSGDLPELLKA